MDCIFIGLISSVFVISFRAFSFDSLWLTVTAPLTGPISTLLKLRIPLAILGETTPLSPLLLVGMSCRSVSSPSQSSLMIVVHYKLTYSPLRCHLHPL